MSVSIKEELNKLVIDDPFWGDDPKILLNYSRLIEFVPTKVMSVKERLNALSRFMIYLGIGLALTYRDIIMFYVPIVGLSLLWGVNKYIPTPASSESQAGGHGDVDGNGNPCQRPTKDNPFMNVLLTDYVDNPTRPPACDVENPDVMDEIEKMYATGLYKDVDDVWNKNNSQRQYYTNPSTTIPNDRDSFMKWCYDIPYVCKDGDLSACLRREDVRGHGQIT